MGRRAPGGSLAPIDTHLEVLRQVPSVREFSTPLSVAVPATGNLTDHVVRNADEAPDAVAFARPGPGAEEWHDVTAAEFLAAVRGVAKGLVAAGIEAGDRVAIVSRTPYEWTLVDYATW